MNKVYANLHDRLTRCSIVDPDTDCWIWLRYTVPDGYGRFSVWRDGRPVGLWAHRVSYEHFTGTKIPRGLTLEHVCRVKCCINPHHLTVVTVAENTSRMQAFRACLRRGSIKPADSGDFAHD
jgi:hypothetical protein